MKKYEEAANMIETNFRRGLLTEAERDEMMDDLATMIIQEYGQED